MVARMASGHGGASRDRKPNQQRLEDAQGPQNLACEELSWHRQEPRTQPPLEVGDPAATSGENQRKLQTPPPTMLGTETRSLGPAGPPDRVGANVAAWSSGRPVRGGYSETEENGTGGSRDLSENRKHGAPHSHNCVQGWEVIYHQDSPMVTVTLSSTGRLVATPQPGGEKSHSDTGTAGGGGLVSV